VRCSRKGSTRRRRSGPRRRPYSSASPPRSDKVGREFLDLKLASDLAEKTKKKLEWEYSCPAPLYNRPVGEITTREVLAALAPIQARDAREAAHRAASFARRVFAHALRTCDKSVISANPLHGADLGEVLLPRLNSLWRRTRTRFGLGSSWTASDGLPRHVNVRHGLQLISRTALRPGELRQALRSEIGFERAEWRVPASRMKMRREHLVPLSRQALEILRKHHAITGKGPQVFPGLRSGRPMSDAAMNRALADMLIPAWEHTVHGFRSSFSTLMNENGADAALIELQLSPGSATASLASTTGPSVCRSDVRSRRVGAI
jgi:integrase